MFHRLFNNTLATLCLLMLPMCLEAQEWQTIRDEALVPAYTLPDPLVCNDGHRVTTKEEWEKVRRGELIELLTSQMYGHVPTTIPAVSATTESSDKSFMDGKATHDVVRLTLAPGVSTHVNIYFPTPQPGTKATPCPLFLVMGFRAEADSAGLSRLIAEGYAVAQFRYTEAVPDDMSAFSTGLIPTFSTKGRDDSAGSIAAWAWTAQRVMDYLQTRPDIDNEHVALLGHSRLGKAALWAAALDSRFKIVFSNNSGCCGTAISRRRFGETLYDANKNFPHWFCNNYKKYSLNEDQMPFDQHEVISLVAPRAVYIASAEQDSWADPLGEFLGGKGAEPVYALYGLKGLPSTQPALDTPALDGSIAYHIRRGGHAVTEYDWQQFIRYANRQFNRLGTWSAERAWNWYRQQPWLCGVNYIPANAINYTAMWDKTSFSPKLIDSELQLMEDLGMNCVRVVMQHAVYADDPKYFKKTLDKFLDICHRHGISVMPIFFDDCSFGVTNDPVTGPQPEPLEGWYAWAWSPSPGYTMLVDERLHSQLEVYVKDILSTFKDDNRILAWDLYNEPTNTFMPERSWPLLRKVFRWAREVNPSQPITTCVWRDNNVELEDFVADNSDIITFHIYADKAITQGWIDRMKAKGRPVICTEWMNRPRKSTVADILPLFQQESVGSMGWGLVNGKTQTHLPWGHRPEHGKYDGPWQHDLYHGDHTPYDINELNTIKRLTNAVNKR